MQKKQQNSNFKKFLFAWVFIYNFLSYSFLWSISDRKLPELDSNISSAYRRKIADGL